MALPSVCARMELMWTKGPSLPIGRLLPTAVARPSCEGERAEGEHKAEVEGLVSVERWSCSGGASCVVEYTMGRLRDWSL